MGKLWSSAGEHLKKGHMEQFESNSNQICVWHYLFLQFHCRENVTQINFSFQRQAKSYIYFSCVQTLTCCAWARLRCQFCPPSEPLKNKTKVKCSGTSQELTRDQRHQISSLWQKSEGEKEEECFCPLMLFGVRSSVFSSAVHWWEVTGGISVLWGGLWPVKGS